jgi:hypothetical protein
MGSSSAKRCLPTKMVERLDDHQTCPKIDTLEKCDWIQFVAETIPCGCDYCCLSSHVILLAIPSFEDAYVGNRCSAKQRPRPLKPGHAPGSFPSIILGKVSIVALEQVLNLPHAGIVTPTIEKTSRMLSRFACYTRLLTCCAVWVLPTIPTTGSKLVGLSPHLCHLYFASLYIKSTRPRLLRFRTKTALNFVCNVLNCSSCPHKE